MGKIRAWLTFDGSLVAERFYDLPDGWHEKMDEEDRDEYLNELADEFMNDYPAAEMADAEIVEDGE